MYTRNTAQILAIAIGFTAVCAGANADQPVYKWVDADGVVHFSDAPPAASNPVDVETVAIPKAPPAPAAVQTATPAPVSFGSGKDKNLRPVRTQPPVVVEQLDSSTMSLADLDLRCEEARERKIAPLRTAEIAKCQQDKRNDPAWCERFNADYGDAGRTVSGRMRPRMFDDLPECVTALQERNRRGR